LHISNISYFSPRPYACAKINVCNNNNAVTKTWQNIFPERLIYLKLQTKEVSNFVNSFLWKSMTYRSSHEERTCYERPQRWSVTLSHFSSFSLNSSGTLIAHAHACIHASIHVHIYTIGIRLRRNKCNIRTHTIYMQ